MTRSYNCVVKLDVYLSMDNMLATDKEIAERSARDLAEEQIDERIEQPSTRVFAQEVSCW